MIASFDFPQRALRPFPKAEGPRQGWEGEAMPDYFEMAAKGELPPDFDQWRLADENGRTVAHVAAESGHLPKGFKHW